MKMIRTLSLLLVCAFPLSGFAQWQWIDLDGRKVFSDRAPPPEIPQKNIVKQPSGSIQSLPTANLAPEGPASAASASKPSGKDPALEAKKKQAEDEEAAKRKTATDKVAQDRAQNCERARSSLTVLQSGIRMKAPNANGDMEYLSDTSRASEVQRVQAIVASDCK
jgi:hypothetical protein